MKSVRSTVSLLNEARTLLPCISLLHGKVYALQTSALSCSTSGMSQALCLVRGSAFPMGRVDPRAARIGSCTHRSSLPYREWLTRVIWWMQLTLDKQKKPASTPVEYPGLHL